MSRKFLMMIAALLIGAFALTACGGDDDSDAGSSDSAPAPAAPADPGEGENGEGDETGSSGKGGTIEVAADPGGSLAYETGALEVDAGTVTIEFANESSIPHDVVIEDSSGETLGGTDVISNDTTTAEVELEPGDYTYYCTIGGHRAAGMEDSLTVK